MAQLLDLVSPADLVSLSGTRQSAEMGSLGYLSLFKFCKLYTRVLLQQGEENSKLFTHHENMSMTDRFFKKRPILWQL